jgi:hypothetical protein
MIITAADPWIAPALSGEALQESIFLRARATRRSLEEMVP